ncbi:hypothetical protein SJAG_00191 [Schizosaccharomyces japonicus yFS275]|uniref:Uncharacterized protein n=1 Tax=Schizosaccharomyces japonicus (strain yFS275 / FY16936) TaxID=402676 RepID=B6JXQ0_SCHJY|nr:hypothetical protein SJAG_00191 [Schizosaccharomyces japonicus yFS275]EEB05194.1 hypothetical protein SJAG_00191 [Schizosaccharomyces japonicus yFS275]
MNSCTLLDDFLQLPRVQEAHLLRKDNNTLIASTGLGVAVDYTSPDTSSSFLDASESSISLSKGERSFQMNELVIPDDVEKLCNYVLTILQACDDANAPDEPAELIRLSYSGSQLHILQDEMFALVLREIRT